MQPPIGDPAERFPFFAHLTVVVATCSGFGGGVRQETANRVSSTISVPHSPR